MGRSEMLRRRCAFIAVVAGSHGVASGGGGALRGDGAGQGRGGDAASHDKAIGGNASADKASCRKPFVGKEPTADKAFKKQRSFWACSCGFEGNFRGDLLCFECCVVRKTTSRMSRVLAAIVDPPVGDAIQPVAAGPVAALHGEFARAEGG